MSLHPSLKGSSQIRVRRNVLKRSERIDVLLKDGKWTMGKKIFGLPKIKVQA